MGTQIIEARNKIHRVEAQNKKTRKVEANNSATSKNLKVGQTIQPSLQITQLSKQFTGVIHAL
jgi:hypothetical protein